MNVKKNLYKCCVCGEENEYLDYMSNFVKGYPDFDFKPIGSMMGIGDNIKECPNCHYASYKINIPIESRFNNNLSLWKQTSDFQDIIQNYSGSLRKILIVAKQYENNMDYLNAYRTYILASWVSDGQESSDFRLKACEMFLEKVLPNYNNDIVQIVDILRMEKENVISLKLLDALKNLTDESDGELLKIIDAEKKFINNNDYERHNLKELYEKKDE